MSKYTMKTGKEPVEQIKFIALEKLEHEILKFQSCY